MSLSLFLTRLFLALQARLRDDERGATAVEYALVVVAAAGIVGAVMTPIRNTVTTWIGNFNLPALGS